MASPVDTLKAAGFDDDEIGAWSTGQRTTLSAAGFDDDEIDAYLGGPKRPVPQSFLDRMSLGSAIVSGKARADAGPFPGASMGASGDFIAGLAKGVGLPAETLKERLQDASGAEVAGATVGRVPLGMLVDQIRMGGASLEAVMAGKPVSADEMLGASLLGMTAPVSRLPGGNLAAPGKGWIWNRVGRRPTGESVDQPIGGLPEAGEFGQAAHVTTGGPAPPYAADKVERLWDQHGIHPAEMAHDAATNVTIAQDLASSAGELPRAYVENGRLPGSVTPLRTREEIDLDQVPWTAEDTARFGEPWPGYSEGAPMPTRTVTPEGAPAAINENAPKAATEAAAAPVPVPAPETAATPELPATRLTIAAEQPSGLRSFLPADLKIDAARFQFKEGGDLAGVTDRLQGVTKWDPIRSGVGIVFEDLDGVPYVVDGHQRVALAQRIAEADPTQAPRFHAHVLRAAEGVTDADARAMAAAKNIAEGTGTALDAAKVLRDRPDLADSLPPRSELVRQAQGLANLSPEAFGMAVNDVVPANYAAIVGRLAPADPKLQGALVNLLAKAEPANAVQAESIVRQGMDAGLHTETQASLFGDQEVMSSLYAGRARILDRALKTLRRDRTVFQGIADNRAIIELLGNRLAQDENFARAAADAQAVQILQTLANRRGPPGDALTGAARDVADGRVNLAAATDVFVAEIRRQSQSGTLVRGADGGAGSPLAAQGQGAAVPAARGRGAEAGDEGGVAKPPAEPVVAAAPADEAAASAQVAGAITNSANPYSAARAIIRGGGTPVYHDTSASGLVSILKIGHIEPRVARRLNEPAVFVTRDTRNFSKRADSPYRLIIDKEEVGHPSTPRDIFGARGEAEETFSKPVPARAIKAIVIDESNPAIRADEAGGVITAAQKANIPVETMRGEARGTVSEPTPQGEQLIIPGAEPSAVQAAAAREAEGRGRIAPPAAQQGPGGLFAAPEPEQPGLFRGLAEDESGALRLGRQGPELTPAEQAIRATIDFDAKRERRWSFSRLYTHAFDKLHPIEEAVKAVGGEALPAARHPYKLARLLAGGPGKAEGWIKYGQRDYATGDRIGPSMREILGPVEGDLEKFDIFATSMRTLELDRRGIETGKNVSAARRVAADGVDGYGPVLARLIQYQDNLAKYLRDAGVLSREGYEAMREANRLYVPFYRVFGDEEIGSIGGGGSLQPSNPIQRIKGSERATVPALESIMRNTFLYLTMAERNAASVTLVDLLRAGRDARGAIRDVSGEAPRDSTATPSRFPSDVPPPARPAEATTPRPDLFPERGPIPGEVPAAVRPVPTTTEASVAETIRDLLRDHGLSDELFDFTASSVPPTAVEIRIFRNGKAETWEVGRDVADAVKGLDTESMNLLVRMLSPAARALRAGATLNPDFMLRNPVRDFFSAVIQTTKGAFTPIDTAKGLYSAIVKDEHFQRWLDAGGGNATLVSMDRRYLQESLRALNASTGLMERGWNVVRHPIDMLRLLSELSEQATRLGEFRAVRARDLAAGMSEKEAAQAAAFASREVTIDFARIGASMRSLNMISAFWNASLQGNDRLVRAFRDNPIGTSVKIAAGITVPSVLLWWVNHDDPDHAELPSWRRDLFWNVPVGTAEPSPLHIAQAEARGEAPRPSAAFFFAVPKPFAAGVLFGSGVDRLLDAFVDQEPDAAAGFIKTLAGTIMMSPVPTVAVPLAEQFANRSFLTDRNLIPRALEGQLPEYQYQPYTTETAKKLGQIIAAFDPDRQNLCRAGAQPFVLHRPRHRARSAATPRPGRAVHRADLGGCEGGRARDRRVAGQGGTRHRQHLRAVGARPPGIGEHGRPERAGRRARRHDVPAPGHQGRRRGVGDDEALLDAGRAAERPVCAGQEHLREHARSIPRQGCLGLPRCSARARACLCDPDQRCRRERQGQVQCRRETAAPADPRRDRSDGDQRLCPRAEPECAARNWQRRAG